MNAGKSFEDLGSVLGRLHALAHTFEAAQLLDHVQVTNEHQRDDFRAAYEVIDMIITGVREAEAHYRAASVPL